MLRLQVQDPVKQVCVVGDSDSAWLMCYCARSQQHETNIDEREQVEHG